jgi:phage terminase small subunit
MSGKNVKTKVLNPKQQAFIAEYLKDFNGKQAAIRAGYSKKGDVAKTAASELLTIPNVQQEISNHIDQLLKSSKLTLEKQIFDYWIKRAFYDITEIVDLQGNMKLTEEELREKGLHVCIDSINKRIDYKGNPIVKYQFADRDKAVEILQKYIGMIKEQQPQININTEYVDIKALFMEHTKTDKDKERLINGLEQLTGYKE